MEDLKPSERPVVAEVIPTDEPTNPVPKRPTQGQVLMKLFYYSIAMFTLPFIAYFCTKQIVEDYGIETPNSFIYASITAVVVVQIIIFTYVYEAFKEEWAAKKVKVYGKKD